MLDPATGSHWFPLVPGTGRSQLAGLDPTGSHHLDQWGRRPLEPVGSSPPAPWLPTPDNAPRLWPAWVAMLYHLTDSEWQPRKETVAKMLRASDLLPKTCSKLIGRAAKAGLV